MAVIYWCCYYFFLSINQWKFASYLAALPISVLAYRHGTGLWPFMVLSSRYRLFMHINHTIVLEHYFLYWHDHTPSALHDSAILKGKSLVSSMSKKDWSKKHDDLETMQWRKQQLLALYSCTNNNLYKSPMFLHNSNRNPCKIEGEQTSSSEEIHCVTPAKLQCKVIDHCQSADYQKQKVTMHQSFDKGTEPKHFPANYL